MKKLIALLLCAVMVFSAFPFVASASKFVDVENGKWYSEGIDYCVANGFMAGTSATTFERKTVLSRAMFVTILASLDRAFTEPYADMQMFDDVAPGKWYSGAVNWAAANGLASGIGGGLFLTGDSRFFLTAYKF